MAPIAAPDLSKCNVPEEFEQACALDSQKCLRAAIAVAFCEALPNADERAGVLAREGCRIGAQEACTILGWLGAGGVVRVRKEFAVNEERAERQCREGSIQGCTWRALVLGFRGDKAGMVDWYAKACELGDGESCEIAGFVLVASYSKFHDPMRAFGLLEAGCKLGRCDACSKAGSVSVELLPPDGGPRGAAIRKLVGEGGICPDLCPKEEAPIVCPPTPAKHSGT